MSDENVITPHDEYLTHLHISHMHAQMALDMLYENHGIRRSFWYRKFLGDTQSRLIKLINKEYNKYAKKEG